MTPEMMQQMMALMQAQQAAAPAPAAATAVDPLMTATASENFEYFQANEIGNVVADIKEVTRFSGRNEKGNFKDFYSVAVEIVEAESPALLPGLTRNCHFSFMDPQMGEKAKGEAAAFMDVVATHRGGQRSDSAWFNSHIGLFPSTGNPDVLVSGPSADKGCRLHIRVYPHVTKASKTIALFEAVRVLPPGTTLGLSKSAPTPVAAPAPAAAPAAATPSISPEDFAKFMASMQPAATGAAPAAAPGLLATAPPGWPASLPWPPKVG